MDLKRLRHLVALADESHFARAAERVHLSQPAFSRSIQALEGQAGLALFDRATGRPTPAGAFLVERARRLLFDARCLERDVDLYRDGQLGDTAFGAGPFPAATLLPAVLATLRAEHPQVHLRVEISNWALLLERLVAEDIEFFIAESRDIPELETVAVHLLGRQPGRFYVRRKHPLAGRACSIAEAWAYGVASTRLPAAVKTTIGRLLGLKKGESVPLAVECDDVGLLRGLALATDTVLGSTDVAVASEVRAGTLVPLRIEGLPPLAPEMGLVTLRQRTPSPMARRAMACVEARAAAVNEPVRAR